jgi:integrase
MAYAEKVYKVRNGKPTKQFTWRSRYKKPDGSWGSEPGFPTKVLAENWGEEQEAAIRAGRWIDPDLMRKPFGKWAREWMAAKSPRGRTTTTRWEKLEAHILPRWEHTPLVGIDWFSAESWANGLTCHDSTATQCLSIMSSILTGAVDAKHILVNPLAGRRRSRTAEAKAAMQKKDQTELWAPPEVVLQLARRVGPRDGLHILTTAFAGVRWGEGIALRASALGERRERFDGEEFVCPTLSVTEEVAEYRPRLPDGTKLKLRLQLEPVKTTESKRVIDLPPFLAELLAAHAAGHPHEYLFCTVAGRWWRGSGFRRQVMRPAADGLPERLRRKGVAYRAAVDPIMKGLTMRDLRHTHDTYQDQIGVRPALAFEQAGHKRPGIKAVYQHPTPPMRRARLEGLQEIYEGGMRALGWSRIWEES